MPELPEVNTLCLALNHQLKGDAIIAWQRFSPKLRKPLPDSSAARSLFKLPIVRVFRQAKSIFFDLATDRFLHIHLGMTGFFTLECETLGAEMHKHLQLQLKSGRCLSYHDSRRFGVIEIVESLPKKVPEPFSGDLTVEWLKKSCESTDRPVKCLIMDQKVIAGLGNIYANEALFRAGIRPDRPANSLASAQVKKLTHEIITVVENAVNAGIASLQPDFGVDSETTHFDIETLVYGLHGQNCPVCRRYQLQKMTLSGRSSFFCPGCQK